MEKQKDKLAQQELQVSKKVRAAWRPPARPSSVILPARPIAPALRLGSPTLRHGLAGTPLAQTVEEDGSPL